MISLHMKCLANGIANHVHADILISFLSSLAYLEIIEEIYASVKENGDVPGHITVNSGILVVKLFDVNAALVEGRKGREIGRWRGG